MNDLSELNPSSRPSREPSFPGISQNQLLLYVGLGSLTMLFGASLVAYFITWAQATQWRSVDLPALPWGVWVSSGILLALSLVLRQAERKLKENAYERASRALLAALCLSLFFLVAQSQNWSDALKAAYAAKEKTLYIYTFFMLTGLHALHVLAGIVPLAFVYKRSLSHEYSSSRREGPRLLRQYWDFLFIVWMVLLLALGIS